MSEIIETTNIYRSVEKATNFIKKLSLKSNIAKYRDFYKGKQWSVATETNKNFPRPVFNIIRMIIENKASAIGGNPIQIKFTSQLEDQKTRIFNEFTQTILKRLNFNNKLYKLTLRTLIDGAAVLHFYWDDYMSDDSGKFSGGLNAEILKITDVYFSDYQEEDLQKQRYIIIETRQPVSYVRSICDNEENKKLIVADDEDFENKTIVDNETDDSKLVTLYTQYFRDEDGEVKVTKATKYAIVTEPVFLNPSKRDIKSKPVKEIKNDGDELPTKIDKDLQEEYTEIDDSHLVKDQNEELNNKNNRDLFDYYPLEILTLNPDEEMIIGTSDVKDLINVQRSINAAIAFSLLTLQNSGAPKVIAKKGALKGQQITNEVGEVIIDHTPLGNQGFYILQQNPSVAGALQLAPQMLDFIRVITNTSEIITGDKINTNVSGTAIAQAQSQAKLRIKLQEEQLFQFVKNAVKIIEKFQKMYYIDDEFLYKANLKEKIASLNSNNPMPNYYSGVFNSLDYKDTDFTAEIEVGYGTQYSESLEITMLDNLLAQKYIDFETYVNLCPQSIMPFKAQLKENIELRKQSELEQFKIRALQAEQQVEQLSQYSKQQEKALKDAMSQVDKEVSIRKDITAEATSKINSLQKEIEMLQKKNNDLYSIITNTVMNIKNANKNNKGESSK